MEHLKLAYVSSDPRFLEFAFGQAEIADSLEVTGIENYIAAEKAFNAEKFDAIYLEPSLITSGQLSPAYPGDLDIDVEPEAIGKMVLTGAIRKSAQNAGTPVVVILGADSVEPGYSAADYRKAGATWVLVNPEP
jgi:hypothetical protein